MGSFRLFLVHVLILLACSLLILLHSGRSILRVEAAASPTPDSKLLRIWTVGSPHKGDLPAAIVPSTFRQKAESLGYTIEVETFPAKGFVFGTPVPAEIHSRYYLWTGKRLRLIHPNENNLAAENYWKRFGLVRGDNSPPTETAVDVAILKRFAERYQPKSTTSRHIPSPPELKERELRSLKALSASGSRAHEKYVLLIFLRLYRFHLENFQQSYHLGEIPLDPLTEEFHRLIGGSPPLGSLLSYAAEDWVKSKPELLRDKLVAREIARIDRAHKKIESRSRK